MDLAIDRHVGFSTVMDQENDLFNGFPSNIEYLSIYHICIVVGYECTEFAL
jgi:hypothetical protein